MQTTPITVELVSYIVAAVAALALVWFRIETLVKVSRRELAADVAMIETDIRRLNDEFQRYQIHVAETYASKQGLKEQMVPLFDAVKDVAGQVRHLSERLDRVIENRPAPARRSITP